MLYVYSACQLVLSGRVDWVRPWNSLPTGSRVHSQALREPLLSPLQGPRGTKEQLFNGRVCVEPPHTGWVPPTCARHFTVRDGQGREKKGGQPGPGAGSPPPRHALAGALKAPKNSKFKPGLEVLLQMHLEDRAHLFCWLDLHLLNIQP